MFGKFDVVEIEGEFAIQYKNWFEQFFNCRGRFVDLRAREFYLWSVTSKHYNDCLSPDKGAVIKSYKHLIGDVKIIKVDIENA